MVQADRVGDVETVELGALGRQLGMLRLPRPEAVRAVRRSIERHGVLHPVVANALPDGLELLDGFKRIEALEQMGRGQAPVRRVWLDELQAKAAVLSLNTPHRGLCDLEEAWVVRALVRDHRLRQTQVAELLGRHKSWVCRRLQLAERLESGVADDMRLGLVSASVARELARLPRGNQPQAAESVRQHRLSSRQAGELVRRLLATDAADARAALLDDPLRFLSQEPPAPRWERDPRLSQAGDLVRRRVIGLERAALGVDSALRWHLRVGLAEGDLGVLGPLAQEATRASTTALSALAELVAAAPVTDA